MIQIKDKSKCCGCAACAQKCPAHCIKMLPDCEGFLYPVADASACIGCNLCEQVCPEINRNDAREPLSAMAAWNRDDNVREHSSSGGVFTAVANDILDKGGIVFGAKFDKNWNVVHDSTDTADGLKVFRGSKYVQSNTCSCYAAAEKFLRQGRPVLFTGTPCQIAGLRLFLRRDYDNLLTMDIICHGVPSPAVWRKYLEERKHEYARRHGNVRIEGISFRDKRSGWKNYSFTLNLLAVDHHGKRQCHHISRNKDREVFMRGYLSNTFLRPSCHDCPVKSFRSGSDITIGDFWGVEHLYPEYDDDKGTSIVFINTTRGRDLMGQITETESHAVDWHRAMKYNPSATVSTNIPLSRSRFWEQFVKYGFHKAIAPIIRIPLITRLKMAISSVLVMLKLR